ncbi:hypothetical protein PFISCL1PPCAC_6094, partial [Pristionchus fissidentatus]
FELPLRRRLTKRRKRREEWNKEGEEREERTRNTTEMEMLKSESETMDMSKVMMQSLEGSSLGSEYLSRISLPTGSHSHSPSPSISSLPQSMNDLLGFVNPSSLMANNMDPAMASLLEQMASFQNQLLNSQSLPFLTNQPIPTATTPSKEAYCEKCDKTFCNKFFLRTHRLKKHGIDDEGSPMKTIEESTSPIEGMEGGRNSSVIRERASIEGTSTDRREIKEEERTGLMEMEGMSSSTSKCDECSFETDSILTLIQHKTLLHSKMDTDMVALLQTKNESADAFNTVTPPSVSSASSSVLHCSECDVTFDSPSLLTQHSALVHGQFGSLLNMFGGGDASSFPAFLLNSQLPNPFSPLGNTPPVVKPPAAKRNYSSAGKNYCDVCNKEVCNKYFLRTHMLKMHGIVIDENKPVIANIDTRERERTGELTFRCDVCSLTLTSRQQLRDHKQTSHGVSYPVGTPSTPTQSTPTRPPKNNNILPPPSMVVPPLSAASMSSIDLSSLNGETAPSNESMAMASLIAESMNGPSMSLPTPKDLSMTSLQGLAKCQHCVYTTRFARNMEYHVERHERLNEVDRNGMRMEVGEEKMEEERNREEEILRMTTQAALHMAKANEPSSLQCEKCHRSFSSLAFLQSHTHLFHSHKISKAIAQLVAQKRHQNSKLTLKHPKMIKNGLKRKMTAEKENDVHTAERHSVTSGSISPLRSDVPEGISSCDSGYSLQSVLVSTPLGVPLPSQFTAHFPFSSPLLSPLTLTLTLTPTQLINLP